MKKIPVLALAGLLLLIPLPASHATPDRLLKVAVLDVGQGDGIYIEAPNGNQMVIDGGPDSNIMEPLAKAMPFGDRTIDVLMVTNPDADHYAGFISVLKEYQVGTVVEAGTRSSTKTYAKFEQAVQDLRLPHLLARRGMTIDLDTESGVRFTVLFPDRDVSNWSSNDGSIIGILSYGTSRMMFTGDATKRAEGIVLSENPAETLRSDVLKVGHHGSATSSGESFVDAVAPSLAAISVGEGNTYGLPKQVTIDLLKRKKILFLRTDERGTITLISNGVEFAPERTGN